MKGYLKAKRNRKEEKKLYRAFAAAKTQQYVEGAACAAALAAASLCITAFAANGGDPLQVVNNLSDFIFGLIRAIGMILLGFGILQVGLSFKSHDPSQRANGILTLVGGIIITFVKEILNLITR